jgi:hypothetical protein
MICGGFQDGAAGPRSEMATEVAMPAVWGEGPAAARPPRRLDTPKAASYRADSLNF